jgi:hypothetical protein
MKRTKAQSKRPANGAGRKLEAASSAATPPGSRVRIVGGAIIDAAVREHVRARMQRQLATLGVLVESTTVRVVDVNGPRGGLDKSCSIRVVLSSRPTIVVEHRGGTAREAFDLAAAASERAVRRDLGQARMSAKRRRGEPARAIERAAPAAEVEAPEAKKTSTASRNFKLNTAGMTSALEDSALDRPSRKSTRGSAGHAKRDTNLQLRQIRKVSSAKERARRNLAKDA